MELKDGKVVIEGKVTLKNLEVPFLLSSRTRATWIIREKACERVIKFFGPDIDPSNIFREDVERYREWLFKTTKMAPLTIRGMYIQPISAWYTWMQWNDFVAFDTNPFKPYTRVKPVYLYDGPRP